MSSSFICHYPKLKFLKLLWSLFLIDQIYMVRKSDLISYNKKVLSLIFCQTKSSEDVEVVSWRLNKFFAVFYLISNNLWFVLYDLCSYLIRFWVKVGKSGFGFRQWSRFCLIARSETRIPGNMATNTNSITDANTYKFKTKIQPQWPRSWNWPQGQIEDHVATFVGINKHECKVVRSFVSVSRC